MKRLIAFAFVASMVTFAACTSKPSESQTADEQVETIVAPAEADTIASDTAFVTPVN